MHDAALLTLQAERDALQQHAEVLSSVIDALPSMLAILDRTGTIVSTNAPWHVAALVHGADLLRCGVGANYLAVCDAHDDPDARLVAEGLRAVLERRRLAFDHEYRFSPPGQPLDTYRVLINALPDRDGAVVQHLSTTEVRRAEVLSRQSLEQFKAVFDATHDAIVIADDEGRYVEANAAADALFGVAPGTLVGRSLQEFAPHGDSAAAVVAWELFLREGQQSGTIQLHRHDGRVVLAEYSASAHVAPGRHVSLLRDVTERRALEEQLRQAQKMEALGQLTGGIAHDFNNILTVIIANAELMMTDQDARHTPVAVNGLRELLEAAAAGRDIVRKLMAFGRRDAMTIAIQPIEPIVEAAVGMMRRILPEHIDITLDATPELAPVAIDPSALQQILLNLASNARDAMPSGGTLQVRLRAGLGSLTDELPPDATPVELGALPLVTLTVSDTGTGMSDETLQRLFEPFFTTKQLGRGTGLGMTMVFALMQQMGGTVLARRRETGGTEIILRFPAARAEAASPASEPTTPSDANATTSAATRSHRILLAEDEPAIRSLAARVLRRAGHEVHTVDSGDAARELLATTPANSPRAFDLIVSDVIMPSGGGDVVAEAVRRFAPTLPVVWMTGYVPPDAETTGDSALQVRHATVLAKPWSIDDLLTAVSRMLAIPRDTDSPTRSADREARHD